MKKLKFLVALAILFAASQAAKAQTLSGVMLKPTVGDGSAYWYMYIGQSWAGAYGGIMQHTNGYGHYGDGNDLTIWTLENRDIVLNAGAGKLVLNHSNSGPVVIGTLNPESGALLTVKGKIACREVKVTATAGADFVFEETYKLPKLLEVEKFVKENKHLPEIPKAAEMETEGYDMGEFQVKLLQKIEELTLYTIEQQKMILEMKEELNQLKK